MSGSTDTLIFLHIPKTGGETLHKILERNYGADKVLTFDGQDHDAEIEYFTRLPESRRACYHLIKGHLSFGLHRSVPGNSAYITFLREPIARALSFYHYARTHTDHYLYNLIQEERADLKALLKSRATPELFNLQTRMIAGDGCDPERPVNYATLGRARQNLQGHFRFVGLTEEFDASLLLLGRSLGWSLPLYLKRNVTAEKPRRGTIDPETLGLLREANGLDLELYKFARERFEAERRSAGNQFDFDVHRFRKLNRVGAGGYEMYLSMRRNMKQLLGSRSDPPYFATLRQSASDSSM